MTLHDTGEVTCPRCGEVVEGDFGPAQPPFDEDAEIRVPLDCRACEAPLEVVMARAEDAPGFEAWVEDRREGDEDP